MAERRGCDSKRAIHTSFKLTAATSHAQHARFAMTTKTKTFTALAAAATLGFAAFATAQPAQAHHNHHHHHHRHVGVVIAPVGPAPGVATGSVSASWTVGAGMCVAYESAFKDHEQRQSETERPLHLPMQGPFSCYDPCALHGAEIAAICPCAAPSIAKI